MYVAYDRFNPGFGLQYANKSREDRGRHFDFFLGRANFFIFFSATGLLKNCKKTALYM